MCDSVGKLMSRRSRIHPGWCDGDYSLPSYFFGGAVNVVYDHEAGFPFTFDFLAF
jgi:hypothetical protein